MKLLYGCNFLSSQRRGILFFHGSVFCAAEQNRISTMPYAEYLFLQNVAVAPIRKAGFGEFIDNFIEGKAIMEASEMKGKERGNTQ